MNTSFKNDEFHDFIICYIQRALDGYTGEPQDPNNWDKFIKLLRQRGIQSSARTISSSISRNIQIDAIRVSEKNLLGENISIGS